MSESIRKHILELRPYSPGKPIEEVQRELGLERIVKLASNENPLGPSPKAILAIKEFADQVHLYPDAAGFELKQAISEKFGVPSNQILLGNGSDEILSLLGEIFLEESDNIVFGDPTFIRYPALAQLSQCEGRAVPLTGEWIHDLEAMADACDEKTKLVFLANPHNPTGTVVYEKQVINFLEKLPESTYLVMDEAYFEYGQLGENQPDGLKLLQAGYPVIALRTFSKAYGVAGLRIGYGFAPESVVDTFNRIRGPFNVNLLAQKAGIACLEDDDFLACSRKVNIEGMEKIEVAMKEMDFKTVPSWANFICIQTKRPGTEVFQELLKKGVIIRPGEPLGMPGYIRVSIGTDDEIAIFLKAFSEVMNSVPA